MNTRTLIVATVLLAIAVPAAAAGSERPTGTFMGRIVDAETGEPVVGTAILLVEVNRSDTADRLGRFRIVEVPAGTYTVKTFRIGYQEFTRTVTIPEGDTLDLTLSLRVSPLSAGSIVVEDRRNGGAEDVQMVMMGRRLRQNLGKTIAETIEDEPGIAQRSMGPAPGRPVLRGLGGDRLLVLEDGERTGDLSSTSADHAVVIEPLSAERIEVIRGPAALQYGSNMLAGVINVVRGYVPSSLPDQVHGTTSLQGESVNNGVAAGGSLIAPLGTFGLQMDASLRQAQDVLTPLGPLQNTALSTYNVSSGLSYIRSRGYIGGAGSYYQSQYGIPGGFTGAHPDGVRIELHRAHTELRAEIYPRTEWLRSARFNTNFSRYYHRELEMIGRQDREIIGTEFSVFNFNAAGTANLNQRGVLRGGTAGFWGEYRDFAAGGFVFTPQTTERTLAGFFYEEAALGVLTLKGALRFDHRLVTPVQENPASRIGHIRRRAFGNVSGAFSSVYQLRSGLFGGATLTRSFRAPGIEELFSEGPHLAAYSFEVGNPDLQEEVGLGLDVFLRYAGSRGRAEASVFSSSIKGFIFPRNTGEINFRTLLPLYQYVGVDTRMSGVEAALELELFNNLVAAASASYVRGEIAGTGESLPMMPPMSGRLGLRHSRGPLTLGATMRAASPQNRIGEFEEATAGYAVLDAYAQYHLSTGGFLHTISLTAENVTDAEYRRHLSRVKSIMPEPGRNVRLLYRVYF